MRNIDILSPVFSFSAPCTGNLKAAAEDFSLALFIDPEFGRGTVLARA
jgi:hypothetical protein